MKIDFVDGMGLRTHFEKMCTINKNTERHKLFRNVTVEVLLCIVDC